MPRRTTRDESKQLAQLSPDQMRAGVTRIKKLVDRVKTFDPQSVTDQFDIPHIEQLSAAIDEGLLRTFGPETLDYERYSQARHFDNGPFNYAYEVPITEVHLSLQRSKQRNIALLEQAVETLEERLSEAPAAPQRDEPTQRRGRPQSRKVFVVHGRDEGAREAVARFLERLGFEAIILHEKANKGRTVIEKIEAHSDAGFAVVLLTPDDDGCLKGEELQSRARQNVLLELGYFVGKLGREHVCVLQRGTLEMAWRDR